MINGKKVLAIIPARGGSKRLPGKNLADLAGKPMIGWTIEAAKKCYFIDEVFVSTDDEEIAKTSRSFGASVPFLRPLELASDAATSESVIKHSLENYKGFDVFVLLQPTSPLRGVDDLNRAFKKWDEAKAKSLISVCSVSFPVEWCFELGSEMKLDSYYNKYKEKKRSQEYPTRYRMNGAIYICTYQDFLDTEELVFSEGTVAYSMDEKLSIDIDTKDDLLLAEAVLRTVKEGSL